MFRAHLQPTNLTALNVADFVIVVLASVFAAIILWALDASLPNSAVWMIRKWFDFWSFQRTNRRAVRERLLEIEFDFFEHYESQRDVGAGTRRATLRALGLVLWEVVRAPSIAASADDLHKSTSTPDIRPLPLFPLPFTFLLNLRGRLSVGPIALLTLILPPLVLGVQSVLHIRSAFESHSEVFSGAYISIMLFCIVYFSGLLWLTAPARLRINRSLTSQIAESMPTTCRSFCVSYYIFWALAIAMNGETGLVSLGTVLLTVILAVSMALDLSIIIARLMSTELQRMWLFYSLHQVRVVEDAIESELRQIRSHAVCSGELEIEERWVALRVTNEEMKRYIRFRLSLLEEYPYVVTSRHDISSSAWEYVREYRAAYKLVVS